MALISHYVVTYNHLTKKFEVSEETTLSVFPNGVIYDKEKGKWVKDEERTSEVHDIDMRGLYRLYKILDFENSGRE